MSARVRQQRLIVLLGSALVLLWFLYACAPPHPPPSPTPTTVPEPTAVAVLIPTSTPVVVPATVTPVPAAPPTPTLAPDGLTVSILEPPGGAQVKAGVPLPVRFVAQGGAIIEVILFVDGNVASVLPVSSTETRYEGTLQWDALAVGSHTLSLQVLDPMKQLASAEIQVTVVGAVAPPVEPTAVPAGDQAQRIIQAYRDAFGLELTAPAMARKSRPGVAGDPWVSVAWIGDVLYQVDLYPDGRIQTSATILKLGAKPPREFPYDTTPACAPAGTRTMLVVLLDYGNLGVSKAEALANLDEATATVNAEYARYATAAGLVKPIFEIETTAVCLSPAPDLSKSGYALTPDLIQSLTGLDPARFDFTATVDLDAKNHARDALRDVGLDTYGWAAPGLGLATKTVNIWVGVDDRSQLTGGESRLTRTLLSHEWLHLMGYPASHDWPCTDGTTVDTADQCDAYNMPALMLGWTDTDGDGVVEILDAQPYGMGK